MIVLYPIKPIYIDRILTGEKKYELRRRLPKENIRYVIFYSTFPIGKVVGYATVQGACKTDVNKLWLKVSESAGILKEDYLAYFDGTKEACAIEFGDVYKFVRPFSIEKISLNLSVPQSFCYIDKVDFRKIKRRKAILI